MCLYWGSNTERTVNPRDGDTLTVGEFLRACSFCHVVSVVLPLTSGPGTWLLPLPSFGSLGLVARLPCRRECVLILHVKRFPPRCSRLGLGTPELAPRVPDTCSDRLSPGWGGAGAWAILPCPGGSLIMKAAFPGTWWTQSCPFVLIPRLEDWGFWRKKSSSSTWFSSQLNMFKVVQFWCSPVCFFIFLFKTVWVGFLFSRLDCRERLTH